MRAEQKVRDAVAKLPGDLQKLLSDQFGLSGEPAKSCDVIAEKEGVTQAEIEARTAEALRALMGYGRRAPNKEN